MYFVKGKDAGRRSRICEWVTGRLAVLMGLPVAPFEKVWLPQALAEFNAETSLDGLGAGMAFGSLEGQVTELTISGIDQIPDRFQQDKLIFDWWVRNADRCLGECGGNPNLFWDPGARELVVIDHNQAFDPTAERADFSENHVFAARARQLSSNFFRRDEYHERLSNALDAWPTILSEVPDAWWFVDDEQTVPVDFDALRLTPCSGASKTTNPGIGHEQDTRNQLGERFHRTNIGDDEFNVTFPFVELQDGHPTKVIKPLNLAQSETTKILEHGNKWKFRIRRLRQRSAVPKKILFAVEGLEEPGQRAIACHEATRMLRDTGAVVLPYRDQTEILEFAGS